jgi:hypothetical protein
MRKITRDDWSGSHLATNCAWMYYLADVVRCCPSAPTRCCACSRPCKPAACKAETSWMPCLDIKLPAAGEREGLIELSPVPWLVGSPAGTRRPTRRQPCAPALPACLCSCWLNCRCLPAAQVLTQKGLALSVAEKRQLQAFRRRAQSAKCCGELVWDDLFQGCWVAQ